MRTYQASPALEAFILASAPPHTVAQDGPSNWTELQAVRGSRVLPVNPQSAEGSIYSSVRVNIAFRAWHDSLHLALNAGFDHAGELAVAREHIRQARAAGLSYEDLAALWADTWLTFEHAEHTGAFPNAPREFVARVLTSRGPLIASAPILSSRQAE